MLRLFKEYIDYKYNINQYGYNIDIIISNHKIQIYYKNEIIIIKKIKIWNRQSRFVIMNYDKITVLHPIVKNDSKALYKHTLSAFKHIDTLLNENKLLCLFIAILSLKDYPIISTKFNIFWNNPYIIENHKLLLYKFKYDNIIII